MSHSFRSELRIALHIDRVAALRLSGVLRRRVEAAAAWSCPSGGQTCPWHASVEVLKENIGKLGVASLANVVLSNRLTHYALLRPSANLSRRELLRYVEHRMQCIFGDVAAHWSLRIASAHKDDTLLVAAVDTDLLDAIKANLGPHFTRTASVKPYFSVAYNRLRRHLTSPSAWFVVQEDKHAVIGRIEHGAWQSLSGRHLGDDSAETLVSALDREHALQNLAEHVNDVYLLRARPEMRLPLGASYRLHLLQLASPRGFPVSRAYDYAMAA